ncbi:UvrD-helicase domain-containing protein [Candidatus Synechococcus spongiarum]|uniref:DNA 3'-5' helicase n=1 Tax=Candidatus Synechococcus spongiarum TaxID=431041 RepID=A0A165AH79_9SYNE|nr:UvrD-helicase domain-containing protein [Candidatus Synechococcus spongiarum]SAY40034.1 ATP-dependent DNA helicase UvrD/PcrA [Candidatus Synechococcus spongiarum]
MSILDQLNSSQRQATAHHCGPLLVVAGAGSGKTRVLTHRIAHLLGHHGVDPEAILAVTFTNKAARQMKERLELLLARQQALDSHGQPWGTLTEPQQRQLRSRIYHEVTKILWIGTFHALFARLLRLEMDHYQDPEGFTWTRQFTIYDEQDVRSLLKEVVTQEMNLDPCSFDPKQVRWAISRAKNNGLLPDAYAAAHQGHRGRKIAEAYRCYRRALAANNALDFDDLLLIPVQLLRDDGQVRQRWHQRFRHLLVDEYQDTNRTQYELLRLLATDGADPRTYGPWQGRSLFVVGDADQSIYSFRAADFTILMDFQRDFGDGQGDADTRTMVKLEQNYRSTATILEAANGLIAHNHERIDKVLHPSRARGRPIHLSCCDDELVEADALVQTMLAARQRNPGLRWGDMAVLYRVNAQSRVLEEALVRASVPYTVVGGLRFYDRREIKDALAYLRLVLNPADNVSLLRVINVPRRGIGKTTLQRLTDAGTQLGVPLWEIISEPESVQSLAGRSARSVAQFVTLINTLQQEVERIPPAEVVQRVIEDSGLMAQLKAEGTDEAEERLRNLGELVNAALQYQAETDTPDLRDFLTSAALASEDKDKRDLKTDQVVLMTFHASKGLEFPFVALVGLEQGLFPNHRAMEDPAAMEEERRLCYVGLTRAKDELHLFHARMRRLWGGGRKPAPPSCFLAELPEQLVEIQRPRSSGVALRRQLYPDRLLRSDRPEGRPTPHDTVAIQTAWRAGDLVDHDQFGQGQVTHCFGAGSKLFLAVKFGKQSKVLDPRLAPIRRVGTAG